MRRPRESGDTVALLLLLCQLHYGVKKLKGFFMYHIDELGRYILGFGALKTSAFLILYFIFIFFLTRKLDNSKKEKLLISCAYFSISLLAFIVIVIFGYIGNEIGFETFGFIFGALFCPLILMFLFKAIGFILASLVRLARILKPK